MIYPFNGTFAWWYLSGRDLLFWNALVIVNDTKAKTVKQCPLFDCTVQVRTFSALNISA